MSTDWEDLRNDPELPRICKEAELGGVVGRGWWPLLNDLEANLDERYPGWVPVQVKEKFGQLRVYANPPETTRRSAIDLGNGKQLPVIEGPSDRGGYDEFYNLIHDAEQASAHTCEDCGDRGEMHVSESGWFRTLCEGCAKGEFKSTASLSKKQSQQESQQAASKSSITAYLPELDQSASPELQSTPETLLPENKLS